ncbi:MAG: hypothetical protein JWQ98_3355 [Chlorobi bacterium]|nr:hypothetical protein [Chlorobiota bacterium]
MDHDALIALAITLTSSLALSIPISAIFLSHRRKMASIQAQAGQAVNPELQTRVQSLEQQVATLHVELADTQDRLRFTERLLEERNTAGGVGRNG